MDDRIMTQLLDDLAPASAARQWQEFVYILAGTKDHNMDMALRHREQLVSTRQQLEISSSLTKYRTSQMADVVERAICERLDAAKQILLTREITDISAKITVIDAWLAARLDS